MNMSQTVHEHKCILHADRTDKRTDDRRQRWRREELELVFSRLAAQTGADSINVT